MSKMNIKRIILLLVMTTLLINCSEPKGLTKISGTGTIASAYRFGLVGLSWDDVVSSQIILARNKDEFWDKRNIFAKIGDSCVVSINGQWKHFEFVSLKKSNDTINYTFSGEIFLLEVNCLPVIEGSKFSMSSPLTCTMLLKNKEESILYDSIGGMYGMLKR